MSRQGDPQALAGRLYLTTLHLLRRMRREDDGLGLSASQFATLSTLVNRGAMTLTELAEAEGVRPPSMTRMIQRLEQLKLVRRKPSPEDGRVVHVLHTSGAVRMLEEGRARRVTALADQLALLSKKDVAVLERAATLLERLTRDPT